MDINYNYRCDSQKTPSPYNYYWGPVRRPNGKNARYHVTIIFSKTLCAVSSSLLLICSTRSRLCCANCIFDWTRSTKTTPFPTNSHATTCCGIIDGVQFCMCLFFQITTTMIKLSSAAATTTTSTKNCLCLSQRRICTIALNWPIT